MYCPKCGIENPDHGKFCRRCGANLTNVLAVVEGGILIKDGSVAERDLAEFYEAKRRHESENMELEKNPAELYSTGVRNAILGTGFATVGFLLFASQANAMFWLYLLIPAFCLIASAARRIIKSEALKKERAAKHPVLASDRPINELPPGQPEYLDPVANFTTNDLVVPSVTEETTQHLELRNK